MNLALVKIAATFIALSGIEVTNYRDGDEVRYPVVLLRGKFDDKTATAVHVTNESTIRVSRQGQGLVNRGRFKVLVELVQGQNDLSIRGGGDEKRLRITYRPQTNPYFVRCVWLTDRTGDTRYESPSEKDPQDYEARIDTAMKLLQTFTAERLHDLGYDRKTFRLELDDDGRVIVHKLKRRQSAEEDYGLTSLDWYGSVAEDVGREFPGQYSKTVVLAAYTRFDRMTKSARGHTALGGGNVALFGSGNVFTWPRRISDVQSALTSVRKIDPDQYFSDSAFRHTWWAAASTTMGAVLHELGHTFDLPHSRQRFDIMTRGFDHLNRPFAFVDPPFAGQVRAAEFDEKDVPAFQAVSAASLVLNRWLALDEPELDSDAKINVRLDGAKAAIHVEADRPIRYIGFLVRGDMAYHVVPGDRESVTLDVPLADLAGRLDSNEFTVRVQDDRCNLKESHLQVQWPK